MDGIRIRNSEIGVQIRGGLIITDPEHCQIEDKDSLG